MSAPFGFDRAATDALGWALLHFVWQGALIAAVFAVLDRVLSRVGANARYLAACAALVLMLVVPVGTFVALRDVGLRAPSTSMAPRPSFSERVAASSTRAPLVARTYQRITSSRALPTRLLRASGRTLDRWTRSPRLSTLFPWLVTLWSLGVLVLSIRLLGGWWLVRRLRNSVGNAELPEWRSQMQTLSRRIGVSRPVRLCRSALVQVPTAIGWLHPMILLPASTLTGLGMSQIEAILAHELAHIRRHDYLVNLLQSAVETLLFYHPAVWWVSRRIREERELCCDDLAVGIAGDPVVYADALCRLERLRGQSQALAVAASGGSLLARIARLLGRPSHGAPQSSRGLAVVLSAAAVVALMTGAQTSGGHAAVSTARHRAAADAPSACSKSTACADRTTCTNRTAGTTSTTAVSSSASISSSTSTGSACSSHSTSCSKSVSTSTDVYSIVARVAGPVVARATAVSRMAVATVVVPSLSVIPVAVSLPALAVTSQVVAPAAQAGDDDADEPAPAEEGVRHVRSPYTVDEWIELSHHGVDPKAVASYEAAGLRKASVAELVALADNGVSPEYVAKMREGGLEGIGTQDLVRLSQHGVTPEFVSGLSDLGAGNLSTDDLIRLADNGITPEWYAAMRWMGYPGLTVDRAIHLAQQGISPEFASKLKIVGRHRFSLDELVQMRTQGVEPEYVARMENAVSGLHADDLIQLRQQGVEPDYAAKMEIVGRFDVADLIALRQQGVDPEYAMELAAVGYRGLSTQDLIRLRQSGVTGEFVTKARDAGYPEASVSEIIRLSQQGLPCRKDK